MSKHRHHHGKHHMKAHGGAMSGRKAYTGAGSHVEHEAEEKKHGGKVHGHKHKHRIHKKRGGGVGSDLNPFSSAGKGMTNSPAAHGGSPDVGFTGGHGGK